MELPNAPIGRERPKLARNQHRHTAELPLSYVNERSDDHESMTRTANYPFQRLTQRAHEAGKPRTGARPRDAPLHPIFLTEASMPDTFLFPLKDNVGEAPHAEVGRTSNLTPQRQVMAQHTPSGPRTSMDTLRALLLDSTAPFADAYERYSAEEEAHISRFGDEAMLGDGEPEADFSVISKRFRDAAATALPPTTLRDALAVIRYARDDEDEDVAPITLDAADKLRLLRGAYSTVAAVMEAGRALIEQAPITNPDTEILSAYRTFVDAYRQIDDIGDEKDPRVEAAYKVKYGAWDKIAATTPQTAAGMAAYLKVVIHNTEESYEIDRALVYGEPLDSNYQFACSGGEMLWKLIQHLEGGAVVSTDPDAELSEAGHQFATWKRLEATFQKYASNEDRESWYGKKPKNASVLEKNNDVLKHFSALPKDEQKRVIERLSLTVLMLKAHHTMLAICQHDDGHYLPLYRSRLAKDLAEVDAAMNEGRETDAFTDTISAFQDEAEKALCLPTAPTVDMLEAGAAAAGINIEQARAIYAAMADAYKKEAA